MRLLFCLLLSVSAWAQQQRMGDEEFKKMLEERKKLEFQRHEERRIKLLTLLKATTRPDTIKELSLAKMHLKKIPTLIYRFKNLQNIDLSDNQIARLPRKLTRKLDSLHTLTMSFNPLKKIKFSENQHLKTINFSACHLQEWNPVFANNRSLQLLILANNDINTVPDDINQLKTLQVLSLYNNKVSYLSPEIEKLDQLVEIDLYHNFLREVPLSLCRLPKLATLALSYNSITTLPDEMGQMKSIVDLYLRDNGIQQLPPSFGQLTTLKRVYFEANRFEQFPTQLLEIQNITEIDLSKNRLKTIPASVINLPKLETLDLRQNPLTVSQENTLIIRKLQKKGTQVHGFEVTE